MSEFRFFRWHCDTCGQFGALQLDRTTPSHDAQQQAQEYHDDENDCIGTVALEGESNG